MTAYDWPTYASAVSVILLTAVRACLWPAYRAGLIDPLGALREL